jgi:hypothetical protein
MGALAIAASLLLGCHPDGIESFEETDTVYTTASADARFDTMVTYAMPDTVYEILGDENAEPKWDHALDDAIIEQVAANLAARGFSRVDFDGPAGRDAVVLLFGVTAENWYFYSWYPWYPGWGGWYPIYPIDPVVKFTSGTAAVNLIEPAQAVNDTVKVYWLGAINGVASGSTNLDRARLRNGIDQMFTQSPYLEAGEAKEVRP